MGKKVVYIFFLVSILFFQGCGSGTCNVIPNRAFTTNINQAEHAGVFSTNGWACVNDDYSGLNVNNQRTQADPRLIAYDCCSTVDPEAGNQVVVEGFTLVDPVSGAKCLLTDGSPAAVAECPLKPYAVRQNETVFYVQNS